MSNKIEPFTQTTSVTTESFNVACRNVDLFNNASFTVDTFDSSNNMLNRQVLTMTNQQYLEWNNNDSYVIDWVATTLGFTLIVPVVPTEPVPSEP